jgi:hypothetical protein
MKKCLDFWVEGSKLEIRDKNPMIGKANRNLGKKKPATLRRGFNPPLRSAHFFGEFNKMILGCISQYIHLTVSFLT